MNKAITWVLEEIAQMMMELAGVAMDVLVGLRLQITNLEVSLRRT
jgi:hypothetical protein